MQLIHIDTGDKVSVTIPDPIVLTRATQQGNVILNRVWISHSGGADWGNALQSWAYRNGYEVPGAGRLSMKEAQVRVRAHSRKRKGKRPYDVKAHERQLLHEKMAIKSVIPISKRVWRKRSVHIKDEFNLGKQAQGALGENIALAHLQRAGWKKAKFLNAEKPNYPFDIMYDHTLVEVKTGLASNKLDAMKWSLTFGENRKKSHKEFIKRASPAAKKEYYLRMERAIFAAKERVVREHEKRTGKRPAVKTMALILNHERRAADLYEYDGVHKQVRWLASSEKYLTTLKYS